MADFQICLISRMLGVFFERFSAYNNLNVLVEWLFPFLRDFQFFTQTSHSAKPIPFASAIRFARWSIFKNLSFLEYLLIFRAVFCTEQLYCSCKMVSRMFLTFLIFDPN